MTPNDEWWAACPLAELAEQDRSEVMVLVTLIGRRGPADDVELEILRWYDEKPVDPRPGCLPARSDAHVRECLSVPEDVLFEATRKPWL